MRQAPPATLYVVVESSKDETETTIHDSFDAALRHVERSARIDQTLAGKSETEAGKYARTLAEALSIHQRTTGEDWAVVWAEAGGLRVDVHRATVRLPGPIVPTGDLWVMLMSTLRYAMGRRSYITGLTADLIRSFRPWLRPEDVRQIRDEVSREIEVAEKLGRTLGNPEDHQIWKELASELSN